MRRNSRVRRERKQCPGCGAERTLSWQKGPTGRLKPELYGCHECDFVGPRGAWVPITIDGGGNDD